MKKKSTGSKLVSDCLKAFAAFGILAWRNGNGGVYDPGKATFRSFRGLRGVSDILGVLPGGKVIAVECKEGTGRLTPEQRAFLDEVNRLGGIAICARSVGDVVDAITRWKDGLRA